MRSHKNHVALWPAARSSKILNSSPKTHVQARPTTHAATQAMEGFRGLRSATDRKRPSHRICPNTEPKLSCQNARRFVLCVYLVLHAAGSAGPTVLASRWRGCGRRQSLRAEQQARCRWSSKEATRGIKSWRRNGQQVCGSRQGSGNRRQDGQDIGQIRCKAHKLAHCSEVRHDRRATALEHIPE